MSYCLNPQCQQQQNLADATVCESCGDKLLLKGRYLAIKNIGSGGFGRTFLAVDTAHPTQMRCVIKQFFPARQNAQCDSTKEKMRPNASDAPRTIRTSADLSVRKAVDLFRQEAVQLRQLGQHTQIPSLFDAFEENNHQYIIQEFIEGENLESLLKGSGLFSELQIFKLLKALLPVLAFAHQNNIIHRDIKPANIIYKSVNDLPYLVDLGAAKQATGTALILTGTVIGSAEYTAPEQARGKPIFASDIYSLGVTCIYLLTGISPFNLYDTGDSQWVWRDFLQQPVQPALARVLDRMIHMSTNRRYPSVAAVQDDLSSVAPGRDSSRGLYGQKEHGQKEHEHADIHLETDAVLPLKIGMRFGDKSSILDIIKPSSPKRIQKPLLEILNAKSGDFSPRSRKSSKHSITQIKPRNNLNRTVFFFGVLTLIVCAKLLIERVLFPLDFPGESIEQIDRESPQGISRTDAGLRLKADTKGLGIAS